MNRTRLVWGVLALVYGLFFYWYTSFGGPLTDEEVSRYISLIESRGNSNPEEIELMRNFLENDSGDDFVMVNIIELNEKPAAVPGVDPMESSSQVLGRYMAYMWPALLARACHPVIYGTAAAKSVDVWGIEGAEEWSQAAFMRYRSRRDLMEIATNADFQGPHEYKIAAMAKTIAFPADPWLSAGDPRLLLALVLVIVGLLVERTR